MSDSARTVVIEFDGDLDMTRASEIDDKVPDLHDVDRLVLDLSNALSVDSSFIAQIMTLRRKYLRSGGDQLDIVVIAPANIRRVLELTGVARVVTVVVPGGA